jgi:hypothetical protein
MNGLKAQCDGCRVCTSSATVKEAIFSSGRFCHRRLLPRLRDSSFFLSFFLSFSFYKECPSKGFFEDILSYPIPDGFGLIYNDV